MATDGYRCCVCEERVQLSSNLKAHQHRRQVDVRAPRLGSEICPGSGQVPLTWQAGGWGVSPRDARWREWERRAWRYQQSQEAINDLVKVINGEMTIEALDAKWPEGTDGPPAPDPKDGE